MPKKSTSGSCLDAREVEVVAVALKSSKGPHLDAREVVVVADVLKRQKDPPPARVRMRGRLEAAEAALKPLNSPPPARFWTQGRWKRGGRRGFALSIRSGGEVSDLSGNGRIDDENEPRHLSWLVFRDALNGPPTSWVPPHVSPSPTSPSID
jgi:hypothetical protein